MTVVLVVALVIAALVLYGVDRALKARARVRRLRTMSDRLDAATARADRQQEQRQATAQASAALTSVMPAIEHPPLTLPGSEAKAPVRRKAEREHTGPQPHRPAHPGRGPAYSGPHPGAARTRRPDGDRA